MPRTHRVILTGCLLFVPSPWVAKALKLEFPSTVHPDDSFSFTWTTITSDPPTFVLVATAPAESITLTLGTFVTAEHSAGLFVPPLPMSPNSWIVGSVVAHPPSAPQVVLDSFPVTLSSPPLPPPSGSSVPPPSSAQSSKPPASSSHSLSSKNNVPSSSGPPQVLSSISASQTNTNSRQSETVSIQPTSSNGQSEASQTSTQRETTTTSSTGPTVFPVPGSASTHPGQPTVSQSPKKRQSIAPIIGGALGGLALVALLAAVLLCRRHTKRRDDLHPFISEEASSQSQSSTGSKAARPTRVVSEKGTYHGVEPVPTNTTDDLSSSGSQAPIPDIVPQLQDVAVMRQEISDLRMYVQELEAERREETGSTELPGYSSVAMSAGALEASETPVKLGEHEDFTA